MKQNKLACSILGLITSLSVNAGTMGEATVSSLPPMYMGAYGGYGAIDGAYPNDGDFAQGRLALGVNPWTYKNWTFGIEAAVQSGNSLRLSTTDEIIDAAGGLPVQSTLKPLLDLLVTVKGTIPSHDDFSYFFKGGIAYRQLNLENRSSEHDTLQDVNGEFQAGLGYKINEHVTLNAFYQGIYSQNNAGITLSNVGDVFDDSLDNSLNDINISHIPTQQAGFLGIDYTF